MARNTWKLFQQYIKTSFPGAILKAEQQASGLLTYKIAHGTRFSHILQKIETVQEEYHVVDYSLSRVSLEQEFFKGISQTGKSLAKNHAVINSANEVKELEAERECNGFQNIAHTSATGRKTEARNCEGSLFTNHSEMRGFHSLDNDVEQETYL